jgi:hypothetical protein
MRKEVRRVSLIEKENADLSFFMVLADMRIWIKVWISIKQKLLANVIIQFLKGQSQ